MEVLQKKNRFFEEDQYKRGRDYVSLCFRFHGPLPCTLMTFWSTGPPLSTVNDLYVQLPVISGRKASTLHLGAMQ